MSLINGEIEEKYIKGKYVLKAEVDPSTNRFPTTLSDNGTVIRDESNIYIKCKNECRNCKIFSYSDGVLEFYCPNIIKGKNIVKKIYYTFVNPKNVITKESTSIKKDRKGKDMVVERTSYNIVDKNIFYDDLNLIDYIIEENKKKSNEEKSDLNKILKNFSQKSNNIIYDINETDKELMFKFKCENLNLLRGILFPQETSSYKSPFDNNNRNKTKYNIPISDLEKYSELTKNISKDEMYKINILNKQFIRSLFESDKKLEEFKKEIKLLNMKPKEFFHFKNLWNKYIKFLKEKL